MNENNKIFDNLSGKVLIATPYMLDGIFNKSLVYMLSHTAEGAIGLIFNNLVNHIEIKSFFKISDDQVGNIMMPIYLGGAVEHDRGFFLHSDDYNENLLLKFQNHLAVSSNPQIPHDIASGNGPKNSLFIIGYTSWKAGQLESEIKDNLWIITDCDKDFIFSGRPEHKWHNALQNLGIKESHFTSRMGNA
ncbi:YqgE/AlgH family protein [Rickettsia endosymbiont of Oedothorax gibbosus]|uniref:YqgE/AlgH family protein n=1 Tax=Rickettsia endosymbiont of Oedothorax gibbosus TaxID=931099 RepID=UPI00202411B6|nr:YqgE/AlgH family protein [Rickettsia endosymbiont of Oedothorax gibbosus]